MSALAIRFWDNPVLTKELRVRMRGPRAYWVLTGYLAFLSFILFVQYTSFWNTAQARGGGFSMGSKIGQQFFTWIFFTQLFLVAFITPAVTSGAITIEKEQRTMEMLEMTRLSRSSIVAGKLLSAIGFVALLLVASLPLTSICFFLGGVSPEEVILRYTLLLAVSFLTATVGLLWSTIARTTAAAVILTYSSLLVPFVLAIIFGIVTSSAGTSSGGNLENAAIMWILVMGLMGINAPDITGSTPFAGIIRAWDMRHYFGFTLPSWLAPVLTFGLLGLTMAAVATARLETFPERKAGQLRLLALAVLAQQAIFFFGARFAAIAPNAVGGGASGATAYPIIYALTYPVALLLFVLPIFATGLIRPAEARRFSQYVASGWTFRGFRTGQVASGLPYLLAVTALIVALYSLSFVLVGRPAALVQGMAAPRPVPAITVPQSIPGVAPFPVPPPTPPPAPAPMRGSAVDLLHVVAATVACVVGLSCLGLLLSLLTQNRWVPLGLLYVVLLGILAAPWIARVNYTNSIGPASPSIFINFYYLNPLMSIDQASDMSGNFWKDMPLMFAQTPVWIVTVASYVFITIVCILLMGPLVSRLATARRSPYNRVIREARVENRESRVARQSPGREP